MHRFRMLRPFSHYIERSLLGIYFVCFSALPLWHRVSLFHITESRIKGKYCNRPKIYSSTLIFLSGSLKLNCSNIFTTIFLYKISEKYISFSIITSPMFFNTRRFASEPGTCRRSMCNFCDER